MKSIKTVIAMSAIAGGAAWSGASFAANDNNSAAHAVFVMTNNADANQVIAFQRDPNGTLENPHSYGTDGRGSGGTVDPLASQGSLTLSADHAWLFAVNAGSGSVVGFNFNNGKLIRIPNSLRIPSGNAVASAHQRDSHRFGDCRQSSGSGGSGWNC